MFKLSQLKESAISALWATDLASLPRWKGYLTRLLRLLYVVIHDLADGQLTLRAMSLVYTTLLSLVPLLAVSFSVLKAFGVHNQIEPLLLNLLAPLGDKAPEITDHIIGFVENMKAGLLGSVGLAFLIYTVVSLIQKVERAFNFTWHVTHHRPFSQRFSDYLSVIIIGPVLVFSALGITASVMSTAVVQQLSAIQPLGELIELGSKLIPYLLIIAAFTFIYIFIPNTKVQMRSALVGALVAGILWETVGWLFASFIVGSAKYTAIYSTFATLIMFMIWLYLSWLILLVGAGIAFYHQHPEHLTYRRHELRLSNRLKERLALMLMTLVGQNYYHDRPAWTMDGLAQRLHVPVEGVESLIQILEQQGLLARTDAEPPTYLPARAPENIHIQDMLAAIRTAGEGPQLNPERLPFEPVLDQLFIHLEKAQGEALKGQTLKDLAASETRPVRVATKPSA